MIIDNTERIWPARDEVADQLAGKRTFRSTATRLILRAFAVGGATILARAVTAPAIVRITRITRQALATALMILRYTTRIRSASETTAQREALQNTKRVRSATLT